jgi:DUF4097 and DUF4098 domain-containing protein YvlB
VEITGDTAVIDTFYPPVTSNSLTADRSGTIDYIILVPQKATLTNVELADGEIGIEGMRGTAVTAHVEKGKLMLRNCFTAANVSLGKGIMALSYSWWEDTEHSVHAEVADGDILVALPPTAAVHLTATTISGHIKNSFTKQENGDDASDDDPRTLDTFLGYESDALLDFRAPTGSIRIDKAY